MKFGHLIKVHAVPAWQSQYLAYHELKKILYSVEKERRDSETSLPADDHDRYSQMEHQQQIPPGILPPDLEPDFVAHPAELKFFIKLHTELKKIERFFKEQIAKFRQRFIPWFQAVEELQTKRHSTSDMDSSFKAKLENAQKALVKEGEELYVTTNMIRNYLTLNLTGFGKILKKFDKVTKFNTRSRYLNYIRGLAWFNTSEVDTFAKEIEDLYTLVFTEGDRKKAMSALRIPKKAAKDETSLFFVGFFVGISVAILLIILFLLSISNLDEVSHWNNVYLVYRCVSLPIIALWYFGFNCIIWTKTTIDYVFILELDVRRHIRYQQLFLLLGIITSGLLTSGMLYLFQARGDFRLGLPAEYFPFLGVLFVLCITLCPFNLFYRGSRWWLLETLYRIVTSPLHRVEFRDFFVADQLTSLAMFFGDANFVVCYYWYGFWSTKGESNCHALYLGMKPLFAALPFIWRVLQCARRFRDTKEFAHIYNLFKYCTGLLVIVFSSIAGRSSVWTPFRVLWLLSVILATCYTFAWDVLMDWGLFAPGSKYPFLRPGLKYKPYWIYYIAMVADLALRLTWTLTISPDSIGIHLHDDLFGFLLAFGEITRRFKWNFFRMENEHVNNCGKFRASKDIPLPAMNFDAKTPSPIEGAQQHRRPAPEVSATSNYGTLVM